MARCSCKTDLRDSVCMTLDGVRLKSCPNCSKRKGRHVFYLEEYFGYRNMGDGRVYIQSWRPECRAENPSTSTPKYECP